MLRGPPFAGSQALGYSDHSVLNASEAAYPGKPRARHLRRSCIEPQRRTRSGVDRLLVKTAGQILFLPVSEINSVPSPENRTHEHTRNRSVIADTRRTCRVCFWPVSAV